MTDHYTLIERAIRILEQNPAAAISLSELAAELGLSDGHLQRVFRNYCGLSPKQFQQALTLNFGKDLLNKRSSNLEASLDLGLSSTSRLHENFVTLEAVSPGEFKSKGKGLCFLWGQIDTFFGNALIAWTNKGIHRLDFVSQTNNDEEEKQKWLKSLRNDWPQAEINEDNVSAKKKFSLIGEDPKPIRCWVKGSNFQFQVWSALLRIPEGKVTSYGRIARHIHSPNAQRAVGSAIGKNPIAWIIPCHRVIRSSGAFGDYKWGEERKKLMLVKETTASTSA